MNPLEAHALPAHAQSFFSDRLIHQKAVSPHTVTSYRDTFRLLLDYTCQQTGRLPTDLFVTDLDADMVSGFLSHLENHRNNGVRTRNTRRAAIVSFFQYIAIREPALLLHCQQVLAIPAKRQTKRPIDFLDSTESDALLSAPDLSTWIGRRDRTILLVALQTGLRVSELICLNIGDVVLDPPSQAAVQCMGKGRKQRATPLRGDSRAALSQWLRENTGEPDRPLFVSNRQKRFSRDGIERIVHKYTRMAAQTCPALRDKRISPHTLRHTAAMELLRSGVSCTVIALWLGHESVETTQIYLHADMEIKKQAMDQTRPTEVPEGTYQPGDALLAYLDGL